MRSRCAPALAMLVSLAACGAPPTVPTAPETPVVVPPDTTATAPTAPPDEAASNLPFRPMVPLRDLEECITELRDTAGSADPSKAGGVAEYLNALAAERRGKLDDARRTYFRVLQNTPGSSVEPAVYFAFAEIFMNEAKNDPSKVALAEQSYLEVLKYPPAGSRLRAVATYRLGVLLRPSKAVEAVRHLSRAGRADHQWQTDGCAAEVADAAARASVPVFADVGDPPKAWSFYLELTADGARAAARTLEVCEQLARLQRGYEAARCVAASVEMGVKPQPGPGARADYCARARAAAEAARGSTSAKSMEPADQALQAACP